MKRLALSGYFLVFLSAVFFSFKSVLVKIAYGFGVDPMTLMLMRVFFALPFFVATLLYMEGKEAFKITGRELKTLAFMGIAGIGSSMLFSFYAIELIDATLATLAAFTYPAMTVFMLVFVFGERATASKMLSLAFSFAGLMLVVRVDRADFLAINGVGVLFGIGSAFFYAVYNVLGERAVTIRGLSPIKVITYCMFFLSAFFGAAFGKRPYPDSIEVWAIASFLGLFTGFLPFLFHIYGVKRIGAGKVVVISSLGPVFTAIWASFFLGESLDTVQSLGMAMTILGVLLLKFRPVKRVYAEEPKYAEGVTIKD